MITTQRTHTYKWPLCLVYCALGLCYTDQLYSTSSLELKEHLIGSSISVPKKAAALDGGGGFYGGGGGHFMPQVPENR